MTLSIIMHKSEQNFHLQINVVHFPKRNKNVNSVKLNILLKHSSPYFVKLLKQGLMLTDCYLLSLIQSVETSLCIVG